MKIGNCELILGDCLETMKSWPDGYVDAIVTSPPFYDRDLGFSEANGICDHEDERICPYYPWYVSLISNCQRVAKNFVIVFNSSNREKWIHRFTDPIHTWQWIKVPSSYRTKSNPIFVYEGEQNKRNVLGKAWGTVYFDREQENGFAIKAAPVLDSDHPYEDPIKVLDEMCYILEKLNCKTIYDPFMGSGTTLEAALKNEMSAIGTEINPQYFELAKKRIQSFNGAQRLFLESDNLRNAAPTVESE